MSLNTIHSDECIGGTATGAWMYERQSSNSHAQDSKSICAKAAWMSLTKCALSGLTPPSICIMPYAGIQ